MTSTHKIPDRLREFNRRFLEWARHDVLTPIARTPPAPHEKGAVERQVRTARPHFFPHGLGWAKRTPHVPFKTRTVWQADPEEKPRGCAERVPIDAAKPPPRPICSDPRRSRVDGALSLSGSKAGSTPTGLACDVREKGRGKHEPDTL